MRFAEPLFLWGLLSLPLFALLFLYANHRRKKLAARFVSLTMLPKLSTAHSPWRRLAKALILLLAIDLIGTLFEPGENLFVSINKEFFRTLLDDIK